MRVRGIGRLFLCLVIVVMLNWERDLLWGDAHTDETGTDNSEATAEPIATAEPTELESALPVNDLEQGENGTRASREISRENFEFFRENEGNTSRGNARAAEAQPLLRLGDLDVSAFAKIPIHEDGRVKPLDTYARTSLLIFNGRSTFTDNEGIKYEAIDWLAHTVFEPEAALDDRIFKITFIDVIYALGIPPREEKRYSFRDLSQGVTELQRLAAISYQTSADSRTAWDRECIRLYENYILYYQLLSSFVFALPTETFFIPDENVRARLGLAGDQLAFSYLNMMEQSETLSAVYNETLKKEEQELTATEFIVQELMQRYTSFPGSFGDLPFNLFPSTSHGEERWFSPWEIFNVESGQNLVQKEIRALKELVEAYRAVDQEAFDASVEAYRGHIHERLVNDNVKAGESRQRKISWELAYHRIDPFYRSTSLYGFAFLSMLAFFAFPTHWRRARLFKQGAAFLLIVAIGLTTLGLIMRIVITSRPPITNLFTTFVFVAWVTSLGGLLLEKYERRGVGILTGAVSGLLLLLISNYFATDGDTLHVLVAVLRSNFWLTTHVISINLGYGGIILSGIIAHVYLIKLILYERGLHSGKIQAGAESRDARKRLESVFKLIYAVQAFGLLFSVLGTILGGIWADQSWGRFWGWDPKENGSLLIVLWSAMLFHARFGGMIRELGFASGAIIGIVVVMLAWFGINLLGVGLHSYGFTEGIGFPLFLYISLQFTLLFFMVYFIKMAKRLRLLNETQETSKLPTKQMASNS